MTDIQPQEQCFISRCLLDRNYLALFPHVGLGCIFLAKDPCCRGLKTDQKKAEIPPGTCKPNLSSQRIKNYEKKTADLLYEPL